MNTLTRIRWIAAATFVEALRQKFVHALAALTVLLFAGVLLLREFDFGSYELRFIADSGYGIQVVLGAVLAIVLTVQLFFSEIENRTALTLLAKPVRRIEFLVGKWAGVWLLLACFLALVTAVLTAALGWRESVLALQGEGAPPALSVRYVDLWLFAWLQWFKLGILAAAALLVGSYANSQVFTQMTVFLFLVIGHVQYIARDHYAAVESVIGRMVTYCIGLALPNFQLFNLADRMGFSDQEPLQLTTLAVLPAVAFLYTTAYLGLAAWLFREREI